MLGAAGFAEAALHAAGGVFGAEVPVIAEAGLDVVVGTMELHEVVDVHVLGNGDALGTGEAVAAAGAHFVEFAFDAVPEAVEMFRRARGEVVQGAAGGGDVLLRAEADDGAGDGGIGNKEADGGGDHVGVAGGADEVEGGGMLRDEAAAEGVHGHHASAEAAGGFDALAAVGEVNGAGAEGDAFDFGVVGEEAFDFDTAHVGGDADVADESFLLGLERLAEGAAFDAAFPVGGVHDAPDVEEGDLGDAEAGEGFFEAPPEVGTLWLGALGRGIKGKGAFRHGAEGFAENVLALVVAVVGGGVEIGDAGAAGGVQNGDACVVVLGVGEAHAAEPDGGQLLAGLAVELVDHGKNSLGA